MNSAVHSVRGTLCAVAAAFALVAALVCAPLAWAASTGWTVTFTGTSMTSDGTADIAKEIGGMQPGDSATFNVKLSNDCDDAANWYMKNSVLKTMEDELATGGSYTYRLVYVNAQGAEETIIGNDTVSGEGEGSSGLFDATTATGDWFFLDQLPAHGEGLVSLYVSIDPESHGNSYFDTTAKLQLSFAAEIPGSPMVVETSGGSTTPTGGFTLPSTGDMVRLGLVVTVALVAIVAWGIVRKRARTKEEGGR